MSQLSYNFSSLDLELLSLSIKLSDHRTYYICIVYRPPTGNYNVALNKLTDVVSGIRTSRDRHTIIIGVDLNIDLSRPESSPQVKALNSFCREMSRKCVINSPTRFSTVSSSIIDVILTYSNIVSYHGTIVWSQFFASCGAQLAFRL